MVGPGSSRPQSTRPRMVDVAKRAGVSQSTVSFVINGREDIPVAADTRRRVFEAADELGFRPNRTAQALRLNSSFTLGVVTNGIASEPYAGATLLGIQEAAREAGFVCMVVETTGDPSDGDDAVASLVDRVIDGLIYASPATEPVHASRHVEKTPVVFVNCWPSTEVPTMGIVLPDEYHGALTAARAVFAAGHRDVAFLGGTVGQFATTERRRGFTDAALEVGIDAEDLPELYGDYSTRSGYVGAMDLFAPDANPTAGPSVGTPHPVPAFPPRRTAHPRTITAVVCGNDRMALGAMLALHELGLEVPRDVSLIGYDDQAHMAAEVHPALTTVALPFYEMGYQGVTMLLAGKKTSEPVLAPCNYVARDSLRSL